MHARRRSLQLLLTIAVLPVLALVPLAFATMAAPSATFEGRYVLRHSDDFAGARAVFQPALELKNGDVKELLFSHGRKPNMNPGSSVRLRGEQRGNKIIVADGSTQVMGSGSTTPPATATKRVAVVLFTFSNAAIPPYTPARAAGVAFTNPDSVAEYYAQSSWGQLTLTGDVYGWYEIASANTSCSYSTWANQANQAAAAAGVDLASYDYIAYGFPESSCGWAGLAYMPGKYSWLNGSGGMSLRVVAHELGHNLGTHHASSLSCTQSGVRVSFATSSSSCTSSEYGDPFTVMGSSSKLQHTNFSRGNFGWLQASNTQTVTSSGDYLLRPIEYASNSVQALRIQRTSGSYLTLEFRQPSGTFDDFPTTYAIAMGVMVRVTAAYTTLTQSQLVDATPETTNDAGDSPLAVGKTLTDPLTGVSITTLAVAPTGATVRVSFGGAPPPTTDTTAPSQPGNLQATALDASRVSLSWSASTDNVGVTGYRVYRNSNLVTTSTGTGYTDTGLSPATTYAYQVVAIDAAGNAGSPASASATTPSDTVPPPPPPPPADTEAPSTPQNLVATAAKGKKVQLSWNTCTDNVGVVGYRAYRDGKLLATVQAPGYMDTLGGKSRTATYTVVAFDAAGNTSAPAQAAYADAAASQDEPAQDEPAPDG
jgi:chitodextrinase